MLHNEHASRPAGRHKRVSLGALHVSWSQHSQPHLPAASESPLLVHSVGRSREHACHPGVTQQSPRGEQPDTRAVRAQGQMTPLPREPPKCLSVCVLTATPAPRLVSASGTRARGVHPLPGRCREVPPGSYRAEAKPGEQRHGKRADPGNGVATWRASQGRWYAQRTDRRAHQAASGLVLLGSLDADLERS